jgi:mannan endo-1,4-beta-mannosidase
MSGGDDYGDLQQPTGGYGNGSGGDAGGYGAVQSPPSPYDAGVPAASTLTAGLGNGVNLQPSYYYGGNVDLGWDLMVKNPKIKSVRIEIELGQEANAERWIREAVSRKYAVIGTFHKAAMLTPDQLLMDDPNELFKAAAWWATNYPILSKSGAFTINLMNEWGSHAITPSDYAMSYNQAIATVRSVYAGPIIVDVPGFGQEAHTAALAISGSSGQTITDPKIILSTHLYSEAWSFSRKREMTTADIDEMAASGRGCLVGEFGDDGVGGKTRWDDLVKYAKSKDWPVFGWAWNGDGGSMNMIKPVPFQKASATAFPYAVGPYFQPIYDLL